MSWTTYLWFLLWLVISAGVYSLYSVHSVEVPYVPVDSPVERRASPCARAAMKQIRQAAESSEVHLAQAVRSAVHTPAWQG